MNLYVISHTHWDREWYAPFETYRRRLVHLMDELIDEMEKNPDYKYFHLDGQTIVLNDYLEIKPSNRQRLEKLIQDGRIIIGPWYVMPDEFLVSGESLIRNLQKGAEICAEFGVEPMKNGYVTDLFGHNSQFPQILNGFGIEYATLFRGMGDYHKDLFLWEADDGSRVLALKMDCDRAYSNFYFAVRHPFVGFDKQDHPYENEPVKKRMQELLDYSAPLAVTDNILMMDGCDHVEMEPQLPKIISMISEMDGVNIRHATLEEFQKEQHKHIDKCDVQKGELYSVAEKGMNETLLKNVLSSTVHLKQMNDRCERLLTRWLEPFGVVEMLNGVKDDFNKGFLEKAWDYVLQNHPHDSICGCSVSAVHRANEYRFTQALEIIEEGLKESLRNTTNKINTTELKGQNALTVYNFTPYERNGLSVAKVKFFNTSTGCFDIFDDEGNKVDYQILDVDKSVVNMELSTRRLPAQVLEDIYTIALPMNAPQMGYASYGILENKTVQEDPRDYTYKSMAVPNRHNATMRLSHNTWDNGKLHIEVKSNGTLTIIDKQSGKEYKDLLLFESSGDVGEGWNYIKPLNDEVIFSNTCAARFSVISDGPLAVVLRIVTQMSIPMHYEGAVLRRSHDVYITDISTTVTILKDKKNITFRTEVDNVAIDHRLRVMFPTFSKAEQFHSLTPFSFVARNIHGKDMTLFKETDTNVSPNQGIVSVIDNDGGVGVYNKGLYEVEVTDNDEKAIVLTLFRSFKNEYGTTMGRQFGGFEKQVGMQLGKNVYEYAIDFVKSEGEALANGDCYRTDLMCVTSPVHEGMLKASESFLYFDGDKPTVSSFRRQGNKVELRIYNPTSEKMATKLHIKGLCAAEEVNFKGEKTADMHITDKIIDVSLNPYKIKTILFELT